MWLTFILLFPFFSSFLIPILPEKKVVRWYCLGIGIIEFLFIIYVFCTKYDFSDSSLQLVEDYEWISILAFHWRLGVDGLSIVLVLLTGFITTLALLGSWPVTKNPRLFGFLMLTLYSGQLGVFLSQDLLLFFLMWEIELLPVYFLLSLWGSKKRLYAATKFILYTALASIFILIGAFLMAFAGDTFTFNMSLLGQKVYSQKLEFILYILFFIAYAVKLPAFPFHTWLPDTHGEAHASTCMLLAGILLKMGGYAFIRINMEMLPNAHLIFAPFLVIIGVINIIYAALVSFAQRNLKRKIAYSSISHMGFVLIGIGSINKLALSGAMLQMISHGLIGAALFFLAGIVYDRTQTLMLEDLGGLGNQMPKTFALFTSCCLASLALPGMSGFICELMIFVGFLKSSFYSLNFRLILTCLEAIGIILTPIYLLSMLRQIFYGLNPINLNTKTKIFDASPREIFITTCLIVPVIGIGIYPQLVSNIYQNKTDNLIDSYQNKIEINLN